MIRGQHIYKIIWMPVGEELALQREDGNDHDKHAVTVMKDSDIVGHVPLSMILPRHGSSSYVVAASAAVLQSQWSST